MSNTKSNAIEWLSCKKNPLYFFYNYVHIPEHATGGSIKITHENLHPKMKRVVKSLYHYNKSILMASRQLGKALSINTPIPMSCGRYKRMGSVNVGDYVLDENGNPTKVVATTEVMHDRPCYRIVFDNNEYIIADAEHLWRVSNTTKKYEDKLLTTQQIYNQHEQLKKWKNPTGCRIKLSNPVNYSKSKNLKIPPYLLGLWLCDGHSSNGSISCHEDEYPFYKEIIESYGYKVSELRYQNTYIDGVKQEKRRNSGTFTVYKLITHLRELNLLNNKHVPLDYLISDIDSRIEIIQGLMDSDGYCLKGGTSQFYQKNIKLLMQFRQLLSSLGIKSRFKIRIINEQKYHTLTFTVSRDRYEVFKLPRKLTRQSGGKRSENKCVYVQKIEKIESVPVKCIQVENPSGMFLCGKGMIPTHNSSIAACMIAWAMVFYPGIQVTILNMKKKAGLQNLATVKFIINNLPKWMVTNKPVKSKSEIVTYLDLYNDSHLDVFFPSTVHDSSTIARSLTVPILYIDEVAFIKDMLKVYGLKLVPLFCKK